MKDRLQPTRLPHSRVVKSLTERQLKVAEQQGFWRTLALEHAPKQPQSVACASKCCARKESLSMSHDGTPKNLSPPSWREIAESCEEII